MKSTYYFSHDFGARNDPRLQKLLMTHGQAGKGVYWDLAEMLYEQDGYLMVEDIEIYAFALHTTGAMIKSLIEDFNGLFVSDGEKFWSETILTRLGRRKEKSLKASQSANARWNHANTLPPQTDGNANKRKGKESKGKESKGEETNNDGQNSIVIYDLDEVYNILTNQEQWMIVTIASSGEDISIKQLQQYLKQYINIQKAAGNAGKVLNEYRRHFSNWLRIEVKKNPSKGKATPVMTRRIGEM